MDAEKQAMQRRIDNLQQHIDRLHGALNESERKNAKLTVELEAVKRERDAAMHDFLFLACDGFSACLLCKHFHADMTICKHTMEIGAEDIGDCFEWRGLCKENGGIEG